MSSELRSMFELGLIREVLDQIKDERVRQIKQEGWTLEHDDQHDRGELSLAAACYALATTDCTDKSLVHHTLWPFEGKWWKPKDQRRNLVMAAAMIVAEIERIDRLKRRMELR